MRHDSDHIITNDVDGGYEDPDDPYAHAVDELRSLFETAYGPGASLSETERRKRALAIIRQFAPAITGGEEKDGVVECASLEELRELTREAHEFFNITAQEILRKAETRTANETQKSARTYFDLLADNDGTDTYRLN